MSEEQKVIYQTNSNTLGLLGVVFVVLKLVGVIDWSWWWVLCPFWIPVSLFIIVFIIAFIIYSIIQLIGK